MNAPAQALTPREAAHVLALTLPQVHDFMHAGELDAVDVHGHACPRAAAVLRLGERLAARRQRLIAAMERELPSTVRVH